MDFRSISSRLAFEVDRRILSLDDAGYYRLDLAAHEKLAIPWIQSEQVVQKRINLASLKPAFQFAWVSVLVFAILFSITNAPAYTKIIMADLATASEMEAASQEETEEAQTKALPALQIESTPFTEPKTFIESPAEIALEPLEEEQIIPEDGILPLNIDVLSYENRIEIPSIRVNAPLVEANMGLSALQAKDWNALEDQIRSSLLSGVVHYPGTADPGEKGNFFVTGHSSNVFWELSSYNTVFALLPKLQVGADIYVTYEQKGFHYRVTSKKEVSPKDVSVLHQGDDYTMTLMTCTPVGTTLKRLVVSAELLNTGFTN